MRSIMVILCDLFFRMVIFRDFKLKGWNGDLQLRDKKVTNWITWCKNIYIYIPMWQLARKSRTGIFKKNVELSHVRIESISKEMQGSLPLPGCGSFPDIS